MHCFYCEEKNVTEQNIIITGSDVNHMKNVLRMREGEQLTVCDGTGMEYACEIAEFLPGEAVLRILNKAQAQTELPVSIFTSLLGAPFLIYLIVLLNLFQFQVLI